LKNLGDNIPQELYLLGNKIGIDNDTVKMNVKNMLNYVEDRRIDYYVFSTSPGYKGYYHKMYDKYFHSNSIDRALKNNVLGNDKTWENYEARIINLTNKNSDLDALPKLREIKNRVFKNVKKLKNTEEAFEIALTIVYDVYNELEVADFYGDNKPDVSDMDGAGQGQGSGKPMTKKDLDKSIAYENAIDNMRNLLLDSSRKRLATGSDVRSELLFMDIVKHLEHIGDYSLNISQALQHNE